MAHLDDKPPETGKSVEVFDPKFSWRTPSLAIKET